MHDEHCILYHTTYPVHPPKTFAKIAKYIASSLDPIFPKLLLATLRHLPSELPVTVKLSPRTEGRRQTPQPPAFAYRHRPEHGYACPHTPSAG